MIGAIVSGIVTLGSKWFENKKVKMDADAEAYVIKAKAEAEHKMLQAKGEIDWDIEAVKRTDTSWKDEWLTLIFTVPLIMGFVPPLQEYVALGFQTLATTVPLWYYGILGTIVAASFGLRATAKFMQREGTKWAADERKKALQDDDS